MIAKGVIVIWSIICLSIAVVGSFGMDDFDPTNSSDLAGEFLFLLSVVVVWAIVTVPVALLALVWKKRSRPDPSS